LDISVLNFVKAIKKLAISNEVVFVLLEQSAILVIIYFWQNKFNYKITPMNYLNMNKQKLVPVISELNILLAEYHIYYQKLRNYHWNIVGKSFFDLHVKFEELYVDARLKIDEIAERILTLRYHPMSRYSEYLEIAKIVESKSILTDQEMVTTLLGDHGIILAKMKDIIGKAEEAGDEGTIDLIGAYIRELEKSSWMLSAWRKDTGESFTVETATKPA